MDELVWSIARTSGIISLGLLTGSLLLGVMTRSGRSFGALSRYTQSLLHRSLSLLAVLFTALHVAALLADSYARVHLIDLLIPFLGDYRPFWQGLGTVGLMLMVAVALTGLLRQRLGQRLFRGIHLASYLLWPIAVAHGLGNGSDAGTLWYRAITVVSIALVIAAGIWRLTADYASHAAIRRVAREGVRP
ncbi:ferric reductase-like transmembrane domain-containing protein [Glutamicibacter sp. JL.03c]|uniref:ferric reductase-like transmembrane domain-containing protein n=1 Tax=Glutamicibacter sp. JL.03c TaxID=2984842 RepID=UPI0021F770BA|nr:ferric reductase-like transmembrane domain-containing protein [Glutamicibacter sp. JL.03c]UYQ77046.1 ferric reductase-like transmembrane domain-containing protein [Glutamicibacter sp. JL.03c]